MTITTLPRHQLTRQQLQHHQNYQRQQQQQQLNQQQQLQRQLRQNDAPPSYFDIFENSSSNGYIRREIKLLRIGIWIEFTFIVLLLSTVMILIHYIGKCYFFFILMFANLLRSCIFFSMKD